MKTAALLLATSIAVSVSPLATAEDSVNATSAPPSHVLANGTVIRPQYEEWFCTGPPGNGVDKFWRLNKSNGPYYGCTIYPVYKEWGMLASYRDGGIENVHWKYTDNENDPECMKNWVYHAADGRTVKARVPGRTTTSGLNRRWCGLPVYNDGGVQGYQWDFCDCAWSYPGVGY